MNPKKQCLALLVLMLLTGGTPAQTLPDPPIQRLSRYNVVWNSPSKDASGVMPLGNGDIAAGVYAIENGDLYLLLAKNDAYTFMGDIFKTGRVRISMEPNPFQSGKPFKQTLDLATGSICIEADGVQLRIWADAHRPVYHVEVNSPVAIKVQAQSDLFSRIAMSDANRQKSNLPNESAPTQDVRLERNGKILWYYPVGDHTVYPVDLKFYDVEPMAATFPDPYRFNTFGNLLESPALKLEKGVLAGVGKTFDIRLQALTLQTPQAEDWIQAIERQASRSSDTARDWAEHCAWWADFWDRSWIMASDQTVPAADREKLFGEASPAGKRQEKDAAALVSQSYNVFRFLMACQSRGRVQTKFNGGLFTQQLRVAADPKHLKNQKEGAVTLPDGMLLSHEDYRMWARRFTFQNQRLLYWPLLASGDWELMQPFFNYYTGMLPMRQAITQAWFGHEGAYYRENMEPHGSERDCGHGGKPAKTKPGEKNEGWYHSYYFTCGLELIAMMLDRVNYTRDSEFRDKSLVPLARQVLLFFDRHYARVDGKLRLEPAQALETWWTAINPAPDIAGLRYCLDGLLAMKAGTVEDQERWKKFRTEIPEIPLRTIEGRQAIAPAEKWEMKRNGENAELYPVFPFRCFGLTLGTGELVEWTLQHRSSKMGGCWGQDEIDWALAGNADEAAKGLENRFRIASPMCRFPLYGKEGPDSCPDFDHFGSGATALQRMIVQEGAGKIRLLPAWPAQWNLDFKLHLEHGAIVTGTVKDGKLMAWDIEPKSRKADVTVGGEYSYCEQPCSVNVPGKTRRLVQTAEPVPQTFLIEKP